PPGPAHPRLYFVDDQEGSRPVARLARGGKVLRRGDVDASLPLDGLEDDRGGLPVHGFAEGFDVVEGHMLETGDEGLERLAELSSPGGAQRTHRPPMESRHRGDDCGVAMAEVPDAEGRPAIDVLPARVVPQRRHRSANEGGLSLQRAREFDGPRGRGAHEITVPMPSRARSTGSGCWEEAMTTRGTPPSSASPAAINFFFIRPYAKSMKVRRRSRGTSRIKVDGSLGSRSRPGTFVSSTGAWAAIATATWAAIRSASALINSPWGVTPGGEITGT